MHTQYIFTSIRIQCNSKSRYMYKEKTWWILFVRIFYTLVWFFFLNSLAFCGFKMETTHIYAQPFFGCLYLNVFHSIHMPSKFEKFHLFLPKHINGIWNQLMNEWIIKIKEKNPYFYLILIQIMVLFKWSNCLIITKCINIDIECKNEYIKLSHIESWNWIDLNRDWSE